MIVEVSLSSGVGIGIGGMGNGSGSERRLSLCCASSGISCSLSHDGYMECAFEWGLRISLQEAMVGGNCA